MSRAIELTGAAHEERAALDCGWLRMLALCFVGFWILIITLVLLWCLPGIVLTGDWGSLVMAGGYEGVAWAAFAKVSKLAVVRVTAHGVEVRCRWRVRVASWDEIAWIRITYIQLRPSSFEPLVLVPIGRIRFVDGSTSTLIADRFARETWNFRAPKALELNERHWLGAPLTRLSFSYSFSRKWRRAG